MTSRDQTSHPFGPLPVARCRFDSLDDIKLKAMYRRSLPSSSRPSTPVTPPSSVDDLDISPKSVNRMLLPESRTIDTCLPALPTKSALRASMLLAAQQQHQKKKKQKGKQQQLKGSSDEHTPVLSPAAPHFLYLSSEEDASSSADDFSDCDLEYATDDEKLDAAPALPARVVSVIFAGKPSMIQLRRRPSTPATAVPGSAKSSTQELQRTSTEPILNLNRKSSASSNLSVEYSRPARSARTSCTMTTTFEMQRHSFLQTDPFAGKAESLDEGGAPQPRKASTMFKRTFSLVRKRSKPSLAYPAGPGQLSHESLPSQTQTQTLQAPEARRKSHTEARTHLPRGAQLRSEATIEESPSVSSSPQSDGASTASPRKFRHGFLTRRKTVRI